MKIVYAIVQRVVWLTTCLSMRLFANFYIEGEEHLTSLPTPLLVVANHRSYWDSMIIGTLFPFFSIRYMPLGFMAADELYKNPFFKIFFILTGTFPAYRGQGLDISLKYPRKVLGRKGVFLIFPFGKLVYDNSYPRPGRGTAQLIKDFPNVTVLPIFLKTSAQVSLKDFLFGRKEMGVIVGKPFQVQNSEQITLDEISDIVVQRIHVLAQ